MIKKNVTKLPRLTTQWTHAAARLNKQAVMRVRYGPESELNLLAPSTV